MEMNNSALLQRRRLLAAGQVQGVGFRPFIYRLARRYGLTGRVGNTSDGVCIEIQGTFEALEAFCRDLPRALPPLARLTSCTVENIAPLPEEDVFAIVPSAGRSGHHVLVSPDVGTCSDCLADMRDPGNRRYRYPFTNCTNCGPRFTITWAIPYDRATTSMACFPLCPDCRGEYDNPLDRRFHAQPNACPLCGPRVWLTTGGGAGPSADTALPAPSVEMSGEWANLEALRRAAQLLRAGKILALKGLGGFHLSCDAFNSAAVEELRRRKTRPHKPLAVMVPDLATARQVAILTPEEEAFLTGAERPIVICARRRKILPDTLSPDTTTVGLVLPYTPLHVVLLELYHEESPPDVPPALVMTSGNAGGEPICLGNREALIRLGHIADAFLLHNRDILVRADDSVVRVVAGDGSLRTSSTEKADVPESLNIFYRRARGYVPRPIFMDGGGSCVLGCGPELKATLCLTRENAAFVSQHIGDLQNLETFSFYQEVAAHLEALLEVRPEAVVCDLHPDYLSSQFAARLAEERGLPLWRLQHHFAHAWSVLAENAHHGPALTLALDGTGLGEDGTIWGGELLQVDTETMEQRRLGRLSPFALPGGEAAIREPWRIAQGMLTVSGVACTSLPWETEPGVAAVKEMVRRGVHCPLTSSCGRLFDAVAALLGLCARTTYEGQAAVRLEAAQVVGADVVTPYAVPLQENGELLELDSRALFLAVFEDVRQGEAAGIAAARFHAGLATALADMAEKAARRTGIRVVGLSGGVLQNATIAVLLPRALRRRGLAPLMHRVLPANDGGLSLGQAVWGREKLRRS